VPFTYDLTSVNTKNPKDVLDAVLSNFHMLFPKGNSKQISYIFDKLQEMLSGKHPDYERLDVAYHDLEHMMQVTLCMSRLMTSQALNDSSNAVNDRDFVIGIIGALLHDVGYLKLKVDQDGTGAKYSFFHEKRGCNMAAIELEKISWTAREITLIQNMISCTGPRAVIAAVPFKNAKEEFLGKALCIADYVAQMSDYAYIEKLPLLFMEFKESDDYRAIPEDKRLFHSAEELITKTSGFWGFILNTKLNDECNRLYDYLKSPYPKGKNHYIDKIEENMKRVDDLVKNNEVEAFIEKHLELKAS
jgi:hypothetical protein